MKITKGALLAAGLSLSLLNPAAALAEFTGLQGRAELGYYLPEGQTYAPDIPVPASVIGHEVGEQHVSHDRLVLYMHKLAEASDRVQLQVTGHTYEGRELLLLAISAPGNLARLEAIREAHKARVMGRGQSDGPLIVALGYSVHGNEASGSNASLLTAYHLAAGQSEAVAALLQDTIVLIDPSLNPDGLSRFAQWVNSNRGQQLVGDAWSREHREAWPGGRTNHYWFDLNRDWLPAQHPESRARLGWFHQWRPHVLADFHEMGTDATFFFQPGVPSRTNPLTPAANIELTKALANFHARALDEKRALYYSAEGYDDFYYGKGSTYPDVHGSIGILFEQASARGHLQESQNGDLGFPFAIRNQFLTSLSTLAGAHSLRAQLAANLNEFHARALASARNDSRGGFVFADPGDAARTQAFLDVLNAHEIEVHRVAREHELGGRRYKAGQLYFVPLLQPQYLLVRALFETATEFLDNTFYDVSAWTLPLAFGLPYEAVSRRAARQLDAGGRAPTSSMTLAQTVPASAYAWIINWDDYYAARVVHEVLGAGAQARVATQPFEVAGQAFRAGSVVVPAGLIADGQSAAVLASLQAAQERGVRVAAIATGLTEQGIDIGSPSMEVVSAPRPAILVGTGISSYEAGEVWHLLDQRLGVPVALLDKADLRRVDLGRYSHLLLVDGRYDSLSEEVVGALAGWVQSGGILVAQRAAAAWVLSEKRFALRPEGAEKKDQQEKPAADEAPPQKAYAERDDWEANKVIGGAIFQARLDTSHPLGFGFHSQSLALFHRGTDWLEGSENPFENVAVYADRPLLAGFASDENIAEMKKSVAVRQTRIGRGSVILFSDIPAFRAFWFGSSRLWANALFFGNAVERVDH